MHTCTHACTRYTLQNRSGKQAQVSRTAAAIATDYLKNVPPDNKKLHMQAGASGDQGTTGQNVSGQTNRSAGGYLGGYLRYVRGQAGLRDLSLMHTRPNYMRGLMHDSDGDARGQYVYTHYHVYPFRYTPQTHDRSQANICISLLRYALTKWRENVCNILRSLEWQIKTRIDIHAMYKRANASFSAWKRAVLPTYAAVRAHAGSAHTYGVVVAGSMSNLPGDVYTCVQAYIHRAGRNRVLRRAMHVWYGEGVCAARAHRERRRGVRAKQKKRSLSRAFTAWLSRLLLSRYVCVMFFCMCRTCVYGYVSVLWMCLCVCVHTCVWIVYASTACVCMCI